MGVAAVMSWGLEDLDGEKLKLRRAVQESWQLPRAQLKKPSSNPIPSLNPPRANSTISSPTGEPSPRRHPLDEPTDQRPRRGQRAGRSPRRSTSPPKAGARRGHASPRSSTSPPKAGARRGHASQPERTESSVLGGVQEGRRAASPQASSSNGEPRRLAFSEDPPWSVKSQCEEPEPHGHKSKNPSVSGETNGFGCAGRIALFVGGWGPGAPAACSNPAPRNKCQGLSAGSAAKGGSMNNW